MWFKRRNRKKSEQDHALSESLRSLQSLLSETDRQEPQLDTQDDDEPDTNDTSDDREPELTGSEGPALQDGLNAAEHAPPEAGNRWQDLSFSFDAEPLIPKPAEPISTDNTHTSQAPPDTTQQDLLDTPQEDIQRDADKDADEDEGDYQAAVSTAPVDPSSSAEPEAPERLELEPDQDIDEGGDTADVEPVIEPSASDESGEGSDARPAPLEVYEDYGAYNEDDDTVESADEPAAGADLPAEPVLTASEPPPSDAATAQDVELELHDTDSVDNEPALPHSEKVLEPNRWNEDAKQVGEHQTATEPEPRPATTAPAAAGNKQRLEDQLHLQLEPTDEPADADIPTLTQAVYVPDAPLDAPEPTSTEPARDAHLAADIEDLRSRLWNVDLDALSPEQQTQLHNDLSDLLDKLE